MASTPRIFSGNQLARIDRLKEDEIDLTFTTSTKFSKNIIPGTANIDDYVIEQAEEKNDRVQDQVLPEV